MSELLDELKREGLVSRVAGKLPAVSVQILPKSSVRRVVEELERIGEGVLGADRVFRFGTVVGESRLASFLDVWFVKGSAGLSLTSTPLTVSGATYYAKQLATHGVEFEWATTSEASYTTGTVVAAGSAVVDTGLKTVVAGLVITGKVDAVPGCLRRVTGTFSLSSFTGGTNRSGVAFPIDVDLREGEWQALYEIDSGSANAAVALKGLGLKLDGSGDRVTVYVRVRG